MNMSSTFVYGQRHYELLTIFEQVTALIQQLTEQKYQSVEVYINNCNHLCEQMSTAMRMLNDREFEDYLMQSDVALYYNLQSVMLAVKMLKNLLENLSGTMRLSVMQTF